MNKKLMITLALVGTTLAGFGVVKQAWAQDSSFYPPIISDLAQKFGLNEDEVKDVFDEYRAEHFAQRWQEQEDRLNEAVSAGVITEEQKQLMLEKQEEERAQRDDERQMREGEMQTWASEVGIDLSSLHDYMGGPERHEFGAGPMH